MHVTATESVALNTSSVEGSSQRRWGFSIAEIAVVIIVLGLLVLLVAPHLTTAANADREIFLKSTLARLRTQIAIYQAQHHGGNPGYPGGDTAMIPTHEAFMNQMVQYTNASGQTSDIRSDEFRFGPYFSSFPRNPLNKNADIRFVQPLVQVPLASGDQGWVYQPVTGWIAPNNAGVDIFSVKYADY